MLATWSFPDLRLPLRQITTLGFEVAGDEQDILASRLPIEIDFKTLERPNSTKKISQLQKCKQLTNVMLSFTQKFNTTKKDQIQKVFSFTFHWAQVQGNLNLPFTYIERESQKENPIYHLGFLAFEFEIQNFTFYQNRMMKTFWIKKFFYWKTCFSSRPAVMTCSLTLRF